MPRSTSWSSFKRRPFDAFPSFRRRANSRLNSAVNSSMKPLVAEENIPQPVQDTLFEFGCPDPAISIAGALLTTC